MADDLIFQPVPKISAKALIDQLRKPVRPAPKDVSVSVFTFDDDFNNLDLTSVPNELSPSKIPSSADTDDLRTPRFSEHGSPRRLSNEDSGRRTPKIMQFPVPAALLSNALSQSLSTTTKAEKVTEALISAPVSVPPPVKLATTVHEPSQAFSLGSVSSSCSQLSDEHHVDANGLEINFREKKKKKRIVKAEVFEDKYELTGVELGSGAASVVKECRGKHDGLLYAVKTLSKSNYVVANNRDQIFREVDVLKMCEGHPHVLQLKSFYETTTDFFFVFEKLEGGDLFSHVAKQKVFTEQEASAVIRDITVALAFLHDKGIAHRDLKPQNVLCVYADKASPAKLCDFNLVSKPIKEGEIVNMTAVGTPDYMAPEVAAAMTSGQARAYDKRCDIWSLGVMLYMLLCGYAPFNADCGSNCGWKEGKNCDDCAEILMENIQDLEFDFPEKEWKHISGAAKDLIARMLVRDDKRITAHDILRHPWIKGSPPATKLAVADLSATVLGGLSSFASTANQTQRSTAITASSPLDTPRGSERSRWTPQSIRTLEILDLNEIRTPKFR